MINFKTSSGFFSAMILAACVLIFNSCYKEQALIVDADFGVTVKNDDYSVPVSVKIENLTTGADTYSWIFEGAEPASASTKDPGTLRYSKPGSYTIRLEATNSYGGKDTCSFRLVIDPVIIPLFKVNNLQSCYPDVTVLIENKSTGATTWEWTFEQGTPETYSGEQPGYVVFKSPGPHLIRLKAGNGRETQTKDTTITVLPDLVNNFDISWESADNDMQVPFTAVLRNNCISATNYEWSFSGGSPPATTTPQPTVVYNSPGVYTITLKASNDKKTTTTSQTITLLPDNNLYTFTDVRLGINTAQNSIGCYFSAIDGRVFKSNEINATNGNRVDFAFFGLNSSFTRNCFVSPHQVQAYTFAAIPGAISTRTVNKQENCSCTGLSPAEFDNITQGQQLSFISLSENDESGEFDSSRLPRLVLFSTADGRRGAIKVKEYTSAGLQSFIVCDVKIMKHGTSMSE